MEQEKVISVNEAYSPELNRMIRERDVNDIIREFNRKILERDFHYLSLENKKVIMFRTDMNYSYKAAFIEAVARINRAGWAAEYEFRTCGHGTFHSIALTLTKPLP